MKDIRVIFWFARFLDLAQNYGCCRRWDEVVNPTHLAPTTLKLRETLCSYVYAEKSSKQLIFHMLWCLWRTRVLAHYIIAWKEVMFQDGLPSTSHMSQNCVPEVLFKKLVGAAGGIGQKLLIQPFSWKSVWILWKEDSFVTEISYQHTSGLMENPNKLNGRWKSDDKIIPFWTKFINLLGLSVIQPKWFTV